MKGLMLHTGAATVERGQLATVPMPERTATYVPINHERLLIGVEKHLTASGLKIVEQSHGLTKDGARYFGLLRVQNGHTDGDFSMIVGVRNSHDKSFPAGLVLGASVFVCDNLSFSGEVRIARKHTTYIERDMSSLIGRAVGKLGELRHTQETRFLTYRQTEFTDNQAHDLIIRALDARVLPVTAIPDMLKEWREPRHPEFAANGKTAWRLFNAFSEILKSNLTALPNRTMSLHGLMDTASGLILPTTPCEATDVPQTAQAV